MTEEEKLEKEAEELFNKKPLGYAMKPELEIYKDGFNDGYNKAKKEHEGKCKTAYIKGIRTMANALKDYDKTDGAWTDYFEHKVDEVLKRLLKESE